ncbi:4'-phosphopantetheinyl transferase superfamily protein [Pseudoalteromonas sp. MMG022]|uniref:4'-phosphopantetheinyl transferase family protein n=1 Tax=Pseudoalteromonas sp. MMG022 TaxID=2909978 RepID=UPI001F0107B5|nr:4'-phosphopantetheinyl transferase superfamily protein [Pseudoalteromonas sp. MMG022]MCF6437678.1 4'-phosphopantetheinyl transferase superfamily protein [Pseudoalteromonas sp. MMG022]
MQYQTANPFKPQLNYPYHCCTFSTESFQQSDFLTHNIPMPQKLQNAVPKRRVEYLAGRICATQALAQLSITGVEINSTEDRAPVWPEGTLGSISHTQGIAMAMVTNSSDLSGLGIDIETVMPSEQEQRLKEQILHPMENEAFTALSKHLPCPLTVVFSAKESIFKALYPSVKRFFGFEAAKLLSFDEHQLCFEITEQLSDKVPLGTQVNVLYQTNDLFAFTECAFA